MHFGVSEAFNDGKIELLESEMDAKEKIGDFVGGYDIDDSGISKLTTAERVMIEFPFAETDLLTREMVNLKKETNKKTGFIKLSEPRSGRKDRYISFGMGNYYIDELELDLINESANPSDEDDLVYY